MIRKLSALAIAAALALTASGCSFNPNPETLQSYSPSDGAGIDLDLGSGESIKLRNFVYLTDGTNGSLFGVIANSGKKAHQVWLQVANADGTKTDETFLLTGESSYSIGQNGNPASAIKAELPAGALLTISVSADEGANWSTLNVPVLDDSLAEWRDLVAGLASVAPEMIEPTVVPEPTEAATE